MIYLDNSATTQISDAAKQAILNHLDNYGNPSSSYEFGRQSRLLIEDARERIAKCINANANEIYFCSGGSEANTWALNGKFVLASPIEHHSVRFDYKMPVDSNGLVNAQKVSERINFLRKHEKLMHVASCMYVNNEIGTIQDVKSIAQVAHQHNLLFHTDAVQAVGHIPIDVKDIGCDMLSASGHKFGGLKGNGFVFIKEGTKIERLINGGKQESGMRPGTENVLGIVAMAAALEDSAKHMEERSRHIKMLRDRMLNKLLRIKGTRLNGPLENRTVSNINICFDGVPGAQLVSLCDLYGICISSGSACNEGNAVPSHVLKAIGLSDQDALNSVRITIGHNNTESEIDHASDIITKLVERIRCDD